MNDVDMKLVDSQRVKAYPVLPERCQGIGIQRDDGGPFLPAENHRDDED